LGKTITPVEIEISLRPLVHKDRRHRDHQRVGKRVPSSNLALATFSSEPHLSTLAMSSEPLVKKKNVGFPVFALQWQDNSTFIASGGGGSSRSGVKNKIVCQVPERAAYVE
jgi:hypothetical protein